MTRFLGACALVLGVSTIIGGGVFSAAAIDRIPVSASFRCNPGTATTTPDPCGTGDRMAGDGGVYAGIPITPKTGAKGAYITDYGTFWFVYPAGSGRSVFFDFTDPIVTPQPPVLRDFPTTWSSALQPNWLGTPLGVTNGMWGMALNQTVEGTLKADFRRAGNNYLWTVRFNAASYPKSTNLLFTCTSVSTPSGPCNGWQIESTAAHRAYLEATTTSGKSVKYDEGTYVMPFVIQVTYP